MLLSLEHGGSARADPRRSLPALPQPNVAGIELIAQAIDSMVRMAAAAPPSSAAAAEPPSSPETSDPASVADALPSGAVGDPASPSQHYSLPLTVALGYRGYLRGGEPPAHGPELALELAVNDAATRAFGQLRAGLTRSPAQRIESLDLTTSSTRLAAGVGVAHLRHAWALTAALGYAVERTVASIEQARDDPTLRPLPSAGATWRQFLDLDLGASWLVGALELRLQGLIRWQVVPSPYRILDQGQQRVMAAPWRIQPGAAVGVAYRWEG